jgi:hypothetical protein
MSFEIRAGGEVNGKTDTVKDSENFDFSPSKNDSLANVSGRSRGSSPGKQPAKRDSIYKTILLSQLKSPMLDDVSRMAESGIDSQSEATDSEDEVEDPAEGIPKKSKFGPRS